MESTTLVLDSRNKSKIAWMKQVGKHGFPQPGFLPDDPVQLRSQGSPFDLKSVTDNKSCGHPMQRERAQCKRRAGTFSGDGQEIFQGEGSLSWNLKKEHTGFGWTHRRGHSSGGR